MKNSFFSILIIAGFIAFSCKKDEPVSERFSYLTSNIWVSDSLLVAGKDASGPGGFLEAFKGEVIFNTDRTGTFGKYDGKWSFAEAETKIVLTSDSLAFPLTTNIEVLTNAALKVATSFPNALEPENPLKIRMTFKAK